MQFLGSLGINSQLLVAQIVDFALLVWLLSYFVYKPTIRIIEENEKELMEGAKRREALETEMRVFSEEKERERAEIKSRNKKAADEIETMTDAIKSRAFERAAKDSAALVEQTREVLTLEKPGLERELTRDIAAGLGERLKNSFNQSISPRYRADFERILFKSFTDAVTAEFPAKGGLADFDLKELRKLSSANAARYREKLEEKFGAVVLEYAVALSAGQRDEIRRILSSKTGLNMPVKTKRNERLTQGFRLEISGMLIESSLLKIIKNAEKK